MPMAAGGRCTNLYIIRDLGMMSVVNLLVVINPATENQARFCQTFLIMQEYGEILGGNDTELKPQREAETTTSFEVTASSAFKR